MDERQVGVRELRQNLSKYLRRVKRGERLEVTEHGRPIAVLTPLGEADTPLARLIAAGRVMPPTRAIRDLSPPRGRVSRRASDALLKLHDARGVEVKHRLEALFALHWWCGSPRRQPLSSSFVPLRP